MTGLIRALVLGTAVLAVAGATDIGQRSSKPPAAAKPKPASKWTGGITSKSEMDDTATAVFRLPANNIARGWLKTYRPVLLTRCKEKELDLYIDFGMPAHVESGDTRTIRYRLDAQPAETDYWSQSTDNEALFAGDAAAWMLRIADAKVLRIEFTPFNANPQVVTFDVAGFRSPMQTLAKAGCGEALIEKANELKNQNAAAQQEADDTKYYFMGSAKPYDYTEPITVHTRRSCPMIGGEVRRILKTDASAPKYRFCATCYNR